MVFQISIKMKKILLLLYAGLIISASLLFVQTGCMKMDNMTTASSVLVTEGGFDIPLSIPTILNPSNLILEAKKSPIVFLKEKTTMNALLYNGSIPIIRANKGDLVNINLKNSLSESSNIHWHGMITPSNMDGHPKDIAVAGSSRNYTFPIVQRAGTLWFHPHPHRATAQQVYMGLAGMFIVNDAEEAALHLPSGEREVPLIISDKRFNNDASLNYSPTMMDIMTGYMGDRVLINGTSSPFLEVKTRIYRFRALNGSNARIYDLALSNGASFTIIGSDGGLLAKPETVTHLVLAPGERADILIDFSEMALNSQVFLQSNVNSITNQGATTFKMLKFKVMQTETENFILPQILSNITPLTISQAKQTRTFKLPTTMMGSGMTMNGDMSGTHTINGKTFSMDTIDETVAAGATEIWEFDGSQSTEPHAMHIHAVQFQVLSRTGGSGMVQPSEKGWKDTVLVGVGEKMKVIMTFPNLKGLFLVHCHNLEHEDNGMMLNFEIQ